MDPLSDVFHLLKVESVLSARIEVYGAWSLRFSAYEHIKVGGGLEGSFWLWFEDGALYINAARGRHLARCRQPQIGILPERQFVASSTVTEPEHPCRRSGPR